MGQTRFPHGLAFGRTDEVPSEGRISTVTEAGSAINIPAGYAYGEGIELRYNCNFTASQFQGIFCRVAAASGVANTSTLRGCEFDARNASGQDVGEIAGVHGTASVKGAGTVTLAVGLSANVSMDDAAAATVTTLAGVRSKLQIEDAGTVTAGYGVLVEHEAVSGAAPVTAAFGVSSGAAAAFTSLIDASGAALVETDSGTVVVLVKFKGANGTTYYLIHDTDAANAVSVVTSL